MQCSAAASNYNPSIMARGANYCNNNKGVALQATTKKNKGKSPKMIACQYGAGCNRSDCIYSHPANRGENSSFVQSKEPCMAFLAGICAFPAKGCRKRHPQNDEAERLIVKYQRMMCRFADTCRTIGCLYQHPSDNVNDDIGVEVDVDMNNEVQPQCTSSSTSTSIATLPLNQQQYQFQHQMYDQNQQQYQASSLSYTNPAPRLPKSNLMQAANWGYAGGGAGGADGGGSDARQPSPSSAPASNFQSQQEGTNVNAKEFVPSWL